MTDRRAFLRGISVAGAAALSSQLAACQLSAQPTSSAPTATPRVDPTYPFYGAQQAGITTPAQDRLVFGAFDINTTRVDDLRSLLQTWTQAAAAMSQGQPVPGIGASELAPPIDTGEAGGLGPSHLTVTFGFGPSLFRDALGLTNRRPEALVDLPAFSVDHLNPAQSGGDMCIQACADDPQVAFHAVRNLARLGRGTAGLRWLQMGFGRTSSTSVNQATPRNLMGFKDGTNNLKAEDAEKLNQYIWVGDDTDQPWMQGGTYLVARRIRMRIESWDRASLQDQEDTFGRKKTTGAPLGSDREFDTVDLGLLDASGKPMIPMVAHIRLAAPATNAGVSILRRGYSFTDGIDPTTGELDAGLFFIAFQRDPRTGFVAIQKRLGEGDALNEYIRHTGSGIFACPAGVAEGDFLGSRLLG